MLWEEDKKKYMKYIIVFYELKEEEINGIDGENKILEKIEKY